MLTILKLAKFSLLYDIIETYLTYFLGGSCVVVLLILEEC